MSKFIQSLFSLIGAILKLIWDIIVAFFNLIKPALFHPITITIVIITAAVLGGIFFIKYRQYRKSAYYLVTKLSYISIYKDTGRYGEYLTYKELKNFEKDGARFLFNVYIPKENNQTSEVDILMICKKGIFVFESKNYSGWIFGGDMQTMWCQSLPRGRRKSKKIYFYNPVKQNETHMRYLRPLVGSTAALWSIIVFSERCTLKSIKANYTDAYILKRPDVYKFLNNILSQPSANDLSQSAIDHIYEILYPYSQVDASVKKKHIENIQSRFKKGSEVSVENPSEQILSDVPAQNEQDSIQQVSAVNISDENNTKLL